jgi:hypothetical protein
MNIATAYRMNRHIWLSSFLGGIGPPAVKHEAVLAQDKKARNDIPEVTFVAVAAPLCGIDSGRSRSLKSGKRIRL